MTGRPKTDAQAGCTGGRGCYCRDHRRLVAASLRWLVEAQPAYAEETVRSESSTCVVAWSNAPLGFGTHYDG